MEVETPAVRAVEQPKINLKSEPSTIAEGKAVNSLQLVWKVNDKRKLWAQFSVAWNKIRGHRAGTQCETLMTKEIQTRFPSLLLIRVEKLIPELCCPLEYYNKYNYNGDSFLEQHTYCSSLNIAGILENIWTQGQETWPWTYSCLLLSVHLFFSCIHSIIPTKRLKTYLGFRLKVSLSKCLRLLEFRLLICKIRIIILILTTL